ncbi:unnamed protein product [Litomosoides sigmodontis]|uniref:Neurotransmitter-gated ion-channel ligand-binding domain-containing protein n=1 Tax=Litomosoides sigmodontis TaxID=42156 RepID=A0A3P6T268_LITSI|nr:unnamed protein product [Litomosoides sigmodontis]
MMANCRISCRSYQGGDKAWKLRDYIASHYDNATNLNLSRVVSVESIRINHIDVDEEKQMVRAYGRMVLSWNDTKVAWDRNRWELSWLNFYWIQIWTPELVQINPLVFGFNVLIRK